jgi:hypothetical protein
MALRLLQNPTKTGNMLYNIQEGDNIDGFVRVLSVVVNYVLVDLFRE